MKETFKVLSKKLAFCILFMQFSCVNDEVISKFEHVHANKTEIVTIDKVPILIPSIQKFNKSYRFTSKSNSSDNTTAIEDLNLDLNNILVYTKIINGYQSYSIPIINNIPNNESYYFENLHIIGNNENSFIIRWTSDNITNTHFNLRTFTGKAEKFDINYQLETRDYYINGVRQPKSQNIAKVSAGDFDPISYDYYLDCYTEISCACIGSDATYCGCDGTSSKCVFSASQVCMLGGGGSGSGGFGGEGGTGTGEGGGGGGGTGTGTGSSGSDTGPTGPVDPIDQPIDEVVPFIVEEETLPCKTLRELIENSIVNQSIQNLKPETLSDRECAYEIYRKRDNTTQTYVYNTVLKEGTSTNSPVDVGGDIKGNAHNHPINGQSIPSIEDIKFTMECQSNIFPRSAIGYNITVCPNPASPTVSNTSLIYAVTVDDLTTLTTQLNNLYGANFENLNPEMKEKLSKNIIEKFAEKFASVQNSSLDMEKKFLEIYATYGISLYKFDAITNNWNKLIIENNIVKSKPCN